MRTNIRARDFRMNIQILFNNLSEYSIVYASAYMDAYHDKTFHLY